MKKKSTILFLLLLILISVGFFLLARTGILPQFNKVVVVYKNSGGFAGLCDYLEIKSDGQYSYKDDCIKVSKSGNLNQRDITSLNKLISSYGELNYTWDENLNGGNDGFAGSMKFLGKGTDRSEIAKNKIKMFADSVIRTVSK